MQLIATYCLSTSSFDLPASVIDTLSLDMADGSGSGWVAPIRDLIGLQQQMLTANVLGAATLDRIAENAYKAEVAKQDVYSVDEHYGYLTGAVFAEIGQNRNVPALRRDLQRYTVNVLCIQAAANQNAINEDARVAASASLRRLEKRFAGQVAGASKLDRSTQAHVTETLAQIRRFLGRQVTANR
jgi:hypothetical protein